MYVEINIDKQIYIYIYYVNYYYLNEYHKVYFMIYVSE